MTHSPLTVVDDIVHARMPRRLGHVVCVRVEVGNWGRVLHAAENTGLYEKGWKTINNEVKQKKKTEDKTEQ